jgi:hypothetical protein
VFSIDTHLHALALLWLRLCQVYRQGQLRHLAADHTLTTPAAAQNTQQQQPHKSAVLSQQPQQLPPGL